MTFVLRVADRVDILRSSHATDGNKLIARSKQVWGPDRGVQGHNNGLGTFKTRAITGEAVEQCALRHAVGGGNV